MLVPEEPTSGPGSPMEGVDQAALAEKWGVRIEALLLSAGGYRLDFRYRVLDPEKARVLLDRAQQPLLTEPVSGFRSIVPKPAKVGALRSTGKIEAGRVYFMLFANPARYLKAGARVTIDIGDFHAENIPVQGT